MTTFPLPAKTPAYKSLFREHRTKQQALEIYEQRIKDAQQVFARYSDSFIERACPVCGCTEYSVGPKFHAQYGIAKCAACASAYVNPCPTLEALDFYYNSCTCNRMMGDLRRTRQTRGNWLLLDRVRVLVELIGRYLPASEKTAIKLLEVGCSSGFFLAELKRGLEAQGLGGKCALLGVDIDKKAVEDSVDPSIPLIADSFENFAGSARERFDFIVHFELIEHLSDPFAFMKAVSSLLVADGMHHFHTPNALGFDNVALGYNSTRFLAHALFPPMHINAFTTQNVTHFAMRAGFGVIQIDTPGNFDVDIVKQTIDEEPGSPFFLIKKFDDGQLAILQHWLTLLSASSQLRCTLRKRTGANEFHADSAS